MNPDGLLPVDYRDGDVALQGYLALPAGDGPHPGVLVFHHALGMGEQVFERAETLSRQGYAAFAADMYGADARGLTDEGYGRYFAGFSENPQSLRDRAKAGLDTLAAHPAVDDERLAAIGFCFGGMCVLELARSGADVKAVASYHGVLGTRLPAQPGAVKAKVAVFTGARDPYAPASDVDALRQELSAAGADWQITEYGEGYHAFMGPADPHIEGREGMKFDPLLDALSWTSTLTLLNATLRGGQAASAEIH